MPSRMKTNGLPAKGAYRGKSDPRMAILKWALENGAVHIKVDGVEVVFPPNLAARGQEQPRVPLSAEDVVRKGSMGAEFNATGSHAVVSEHPDEYARQADDWASFKPLSARG